ncbi:MAG TPA: head GIN domain-containing protein [Myxococcales bacterium]|nr:head GIN domain-containing protein [Myxococcales bacterium]
MRGSVLIALLSAACAHESVRGNGRTTRELRDLPRFDSVAVHSGIRAEVEIGPQAPVQVDADENLLPLVVTEVADGTLSIRFRYDTSVSSEQPVRVRVRIPAVHRLDATGGAGLRAELEPGQDLEVHSSGGSEVRVRGLNASLLSVSGSGGARVQLSGAADTVRLRISGGTRVRAASLAARAVNVHGSGGASAEIRASGVVRGSLSGGSNVHVLGRASSRVSTSGGSSVDFDD